MDQADTSRLRAEARATIKAAAADLDEVAGRWPVLPEHLRAQASILYRLSQELAEAAGMLQRSTPQAARLEAARIGVSCGGIGVS
jgi:hypothetical protein